MQAKDLKQKSKQELERLLRESRERLRGLRFDIQLKQFKNVRKIREVKKLIARLLTIIKQKE